MIKGYFFCLANTLYVDLIANNLDALYKNVTGLHFLTNSKQYSFVYQYHYLLHGVCKNDKFDVLLRVRLFNSFRSLTLSALPVSSANVSISS
jgi:hypothetical protein